MGGHGPRPGALKHWPPSVTRRLHGRRQVGSARLQNVLRGLHLRAVRDGGGRLSGQRLSEEHTRPCEPHRAFALCTRCFLSSGAADGQRRTAAGDWVQPGAGPREALARLPSGGRLAVHPSSFLPPVHACDHTPLGQVSSPESGLPARFTLTCAQRRHPGLPSTPPEHPGRALGQPAHAHCPREGAEAQPGAARAVRSQNVHVVGLRYHLKPSDSNACPPL